MFSSLSFFNPFSFSPSFSQCVCLGGGTAETELSFFSWHAAAAANGFGVAASRKMVGEMGVCACVGMEASAFSLLFSPVKSLLSHVALFKRSRFSLKILGLLLGGGFLNDV